MLGGVASALVVGFLLDAGDSYSAIVGDSYEDQVTRDDIMADEEFWSQLTPEQQVEARELLGKASAALNGDGGGGGGEGAGGRGRARRPPLPPPGRRRTYPCSTTTRAQGIRGGGRPGGRGQEAGAGTPPPPPAKRHGRCHRNPGPMEK